jgi:cytochrome c55X
VRNVAALLALAATVGIVGAAIGQPLPDRQSEIIHRLTQDCGSCHGLTLKGGLGPSLLPTVLDARPDEYLVHVILHGKPGTPMPPWSFELAEDEAAWLVARLKQGLRDGQ